MSAQSPQIDKFLNLLIQYKGSDLHIAVGVPPMLRVNGALKRINYDPLTQEQVQFLLEEIMDERQRAIHANELDFDFAYEAKGLGRFRVNAFRQKNGLSAVFRVVPTQIPMPDEINMPHAVRQLSQRHNGLVLITGPTGSGKSTTLATLVDCINRTRACHIITIEDPIEFVHESKKSLISQREIGQHAASFARALRAALREDPDVILVGEMRDLETIQLAVTAAETGHLVLGTLHTASAPKAIDRIIDSFPADQQNQMRVQLAESLAAVVAQQLLPVCNGEGRIAAFEVLIAVPAIRNLIRDNRIHQIPNAMQVHRKEGCQNMDAALAELVRRGLVLESEALARAHDRRTFEMELKKGAQPTS